MPITWNAENAAHLLRRTGFAVTPKQLAKALKQGQDKTLAGLLKFEKKPAKWPKKGTDGTERLGAWWVRRMLKTKRPLIEKLTLFWHNHFATAMHKVDDSEAMFNHVATLRVNALGTFRDMLLDVARDPAMLDWLDNRINYADSINENFARELMELFTTGVLDKDGQPNYTETDVIEVARSFTGWSVKHDAFLFKANKHDEGEKTVKGVTGNLGGEDVVDILINDPATQRRIPQKLWSFLAYPIELTDPLCDELEAVYISSGGDLRVIVEAILRHDQFYAPEAKKALVKGPAEWFVGALRQTGAKLKKGNSWEVGSRLAELGQPLFDPPSVFGWDEGLAWVEASGMLARASTGEWIADTRKNKWHALTLKTKKWLGPKKGWSDLDAAGVVALVLEHLDLADASPNTVAALTTYAEADMFGLPQEVEVTPDFIDLKVRGLFAIALASPEYQVA